MAPGARFQWGSIVINTLSPNTKAILLLTAPLIIGRTRASVPLLAHREYNRLEVHLRSIGHEPADFISGKVGQLVDRCTSIVDAARLESLLSRGFLLSQAVERWHARAIWVVSRADSAYPQRLRSRLKERAPAVLYGCGERSALDNGGLAVVGSRSADDGLVEYTAGIGRLAAKSRSTVVSGGARGVDQAAMSGALEAGGNAVGVLADGLERAVTNRGYRDLLLEGRLTLISPYDPSSGFSVGNAMQRNKSIYALADAALVVSAEVKTGGTWAGAKEQLKELHLVPIYVRSTGQPSQGLKALEELGARPWPNPTEGSELERVLAAAATAPAGIAEQGKLALEGSKTEERPAEAVREPLAPTMSPPLGGPVERPASQDLKGRLFENFRDLALSVLAEPRKAAEVAQALGVTQRQAEIWLTRLVDEGLLEKTTKPARYARRPRGLFQYAGDEEAVP